MGVPTGRKVRFIRALGLGSDHFGKCEVCEKHMSEAYKGQYKKEWLRGDGEAYFSPGVSLYGHESCIINQMPIEIIHDEQAA